MIEFVNLFNMLFFSKAFFLDDANITLNKTDNIPVLIELKFHFQKVKEVVFQKVKSAVHKKIREEG